MDTVLETKKRLDISNDIVSKLEGLVNGVILGGSMGYGQNYSVTDKSDIDMAIIVDVDKVDLITRLHPQTVHLYLRPHFWHSHVPALLLK